IPAIIGITTDPFLVFTSNVFASLGLRSLYFALKGFADMFHYLKYGLAFILVFIGGKMMAAHYYHMPIAVTMSVIFGTLLVSVLVSIWSNRKKQQSHYEGGLFVFLGDDVVEVPEVEKIAEEKQATGQQP